MKLTIRRLLNMLLHLSFCVMIGTGLMMAYRLVPGSRGGKGLAVLGWNRHQWGDLHTWVAYLFVILILVHLALNWTCLVKCAAIIGAFLLLPLTKREGGRGRQRQYHVMARGDRREPIFLCDQDRKLLLATLLGETCPKTSIGGCVNISY